jgi:hypothetical protein
LQASFATQFSNIVSYSLHNIWTTQFLQNDLLFFPYKFATQFQSLWLFYKFELSLFFPDLPLFSTNLLPNSSIIATFSTNLRYSILLPKWLTFSLQICYQFS